jgi:hypothetical protein
MNKINIHESVKMKLKNFIVNNKIPHIIFHGPSGSGKRHILNYFINEIYNDIIQIKKYVKFVNCAHGKGIRFIRDELKFFAKTNINNKGGKVFKSIVLFNADKLTIDAQSALRRCIEQFSHTTRFFIIVEEQSKLLKPILSRFCNIYIPMCVINNETQSLHFYKNDKLLSNTEPFFIKRRKWLKEKLENQKNYNNIKKCCKFSEMLYQKGYSCLDIMDIFEKDTILNIENKNILLIYFDKIRKEFRNEKQIMFFIINYSLMRKNLCLENIYNL